MLTLGRKDPDRLKLKLSFIRQATRMNSVSAETLLLLLLFYFTFFFFFFFLGGVTPQQLSTDNVSFLLFLNNGIFITDAALFALHRVILIQK